jgi:DNA primase
MIDRVNLCLDHDTAGIEAGQKIKDQLIEKGWAAGNICRLVPNMKDWNEILKAQNGADAIPAKPHPKIEAYKRITRGLINYDVQSQNGLRTLGGVGQSYEDKWNTLADEIGDRLHKLLGIVDKGNLDVIQTVGGRLLSDIVCSCLYLEVRREIGQNIDDAVVETKQLQALADQLFSHYKPYKDTGQLKRRCADISAAYAALMTHHQCAGTDDYINSRLLALTDQCIRAKIYLETEYKHELEIHRGIEEQTVQPADGQANKQSVRLETEGISQTLA